MKSLLIFLLTSIFTFPILANENSIDCPNSSRGIVALIQASDIACFQAVNIANDCALGSAEDLKIAGAASNVCLKEAGTLSASDTKLLAAMKDRCNQTFKDKSGTLYLSLNAFCQLKAVEFIRNVQADTTEN